MCFAVGREDKAGWDGDENVLSMFQLLGCLLYKRVSVCIYPWITPELPPPLEPTPL